MPPNAALYDTDFYAWANGQAALLRAGRLAEADIENIAEEIESMVRSERRELVSRLSILLLRLLKWRFQPALQSHTWRQTIEQQRLHLQRHLSENPSLTSQLDAAMIRAYRHARVDAEHETGLLRTAFPAGCPFTFDEVMRPDFWPG